ncbi:TPA: hypothetical protein HA361_06920 [Candidatus Woesearchaeota archaeon]|nr:hypothetical protein [Candidatus Woesearchaeota archaeon]HII69176.1 hypothetical protein [Candidatus Woesearchaeota archaeon]
MAATHALPPALPEPFLFSPFFSSLFFSPSEFAMRCSPETKGIKLPNVRRGKKTAAIAFFSNELFGNAKSNPAKVALKFQAPHEGLRRSLKKRGFISATLK